MSERKSPSIIRAAHGTAAAAGALLVVETPVLDELAPLNPADTVAGLALAKRRGRPFERGNAAASGRGPSLERITCPDGAPEERRRVYRKAASMAAKRRRELEIISGGPVTSGVRFEIVAWARAAAWSEFFDHAGDAMKAAALAEKASGHGLKAIGIAEREAAARPKPHVDPLAKWMRPKESP